MSGPTILFQHLREAVSDKGGRNSHYAHRYHDLHRTNPHTRWDGGGGDDGKPVGGFAGEGGKCGHAQAVHLTTDSMRAGDAVGNAN